MNEIKEIETRFISEVDKWLISGDEDAKEDFMYSAQEIVIKRRLKPLSVRALYEKISGQPLCVETALLHQEG